MVELFALDFTRCEQPGYWDDAYTPFSIFDSERVVANGCLYLLDAVIYGRATRLAQVSAVGTLPRFRRRGLCRELTNAALAWAQGRHAGVFLLGNDEAVPVYERAGFMPLAEFVERMPTPAVAPRAGLVKLDMDDPRDWRRWPRGARRCRGGWQSATRG